MMKSEPTAARVRGTISTGSGGGRSEVPPQSSVRLLVRAGGEVIARALHTAGREPARTKGVDRRLDRRCADRKRMVRIPSGVQDLQQDLAARVVHRAGDAAVPA